MSPGLTDWEFSSRGDAVLRNGALIDIARSRKTTAILPEVTLAISPATLRGGLDVAASHMRFLTSRTTGRRAVGKPSINQLARKLPEAAAEANPISLNLHLVFYD